MEIQHFFLKTCVALFLAIVAAPSALAAKQLDDLYEAVVPLADRSDLARNEAIVEGLSQVFTRYSGYSGVSGLSGVQAALDDAESYLVEFSVEMLSVPAQDGLMVEETEALWLRYNASLVDGLVNKNQLPIWSTLRPEVSYLVIQELWEQPTYMDKNSLPAMNAALSNSFTARGLHSLPQDKPELSAEKVWNMSEVDAYSLRQQSGADIFVLVRISDDVKRGSSIAEIVFVEESEQSVFRPQSGTPVKDIFLAVNEFVDSYSANYAFLGGNEQVSNIYVSTLGLTEFMDYRQFLDQLSNLERVSQARLEALRGDQMLFRVAYGSNKDVLLSDLLQQADLKVHDRHFNALGTRTDPIVLTVPGYKMPAPVEQIFIEPRVILPVQSSGSAAPIESR